MSDEARLVEAVEAAGWADLVRACPPPLAQGLGLAAVEEGAAASSMAPKMPIPLFNRSFGWQTPGEWQAALKRHRDSGAPDFFLQPPPWLNTGFAGDGLQRRSRWAKTIRGAEPVAAMPTTLNIAEARPQDGEAFAAAAVGGFGMPPALAPWLVAMVGRPGWHTYVGWDGVQPVAAGALYIRGGTAWCGLGATLPSHRGRGGQCALLARRVADALAQGCRVIVTETGEDTADAPNPSFRNMMRTGFRTVHFRDNWGPPR
jgi:GNAT superfamily N-acetyltransferase